MRVLIAEDEKLTRTMLRRKLEKEGIECVLAEDGERAWEILRYPNAPSIALLDWMMPGMTGIEVCSKVREQSRDDYVYIIMLTGKVEEEDVLTGLAAGADDYLKKPVSNQELYARLRAADRIVSQDQHMRRLLSRHLQVLEAIPSGLIVTDNNDNVIEWNDNAATLFTLSSEDTVGKKFTSLDLDWQWPEILEGIAECWDRQETLVIPSLRACVSKGSQSPKILDVTITPLSQMRHAFPSVLIVINDVTQQRALQEKLYLAQKLESVGRLSAGVAHEINTPSQFVRNNLTFLQGCFEQIAPHLRNVVDQPIEPNDVNSLLTDIPLALTEALNGINRVTDIVRAISNYIHPDSEQTTLVSINNLLDGCLTMTRHVWKNHATIEKDYDDSLKSVHCYQSSLQQVIVNLLVNASHTLEERHGSPSVGKIILKTRVDGESVKITVQDNGSGIRPEHLNKIFDPFFTTKGVGEGTGQGLALSRQIIVDQHQGKLEVDSRPGEGSSFIISLPI